MRLLLAIAVTVAQVAGPWLCCCGPARLLAAAPAESHAPVSPASAASGCPFCRHTEPDLTPTARDASPPASPKPGLPAPCPCGGVSLEAIPPAVADRDAIADATAPFALPALWVLAPDVPIPQVQSANLPGTSDLPFLTTATRLWVHHALRC